MFTVQNGRQIAHWDQSVVFAAIEWPREEANEGNHFSAFGIILT